MKLVFKLLISAVILVALCLLDLAYEPTLFAYSIGAIKNIQRGLTESGKIIFEGLSLLGQGPIYVGLFAVLFNITSRAVSYYYLFFNMMGMFIMNTLKIAYHDPRPYMVD